MHPDLLTAPDTGVGGRQEEKHLCLPKARDPISQNPAQPPNVMILINDSFCSLSSQSMSRGSTGCKRTSRPLQLPFGSLTKTKLKGFDSV